MKRACVFDLDGTLADTLASIAYFANRALTRVGLKEIETKRYRYLVGDGARVLVERMLQEAGDTGGRFFDEVYRCYNRTYDENFMYLTKAYDGILPLIAQLKKLGCRLAVLSNKPHATTVKIVRTLFGDTTFDLCFGQREGIPKKPDPAALLQILKNLEVQPQNCAYFGDTATDMKTGNAAGAHTVGVLWGFRERAELEQSGAWGVVASPGGVIDYLQHVNFLK